MAKAARPSRAKRGASKLSPANGIRLPRVAKGKRPQYFSDPATDKLLWIALTLMEELSVTRDRLDSVERVLAAKHVLAPDEIDNFVPASAAARQRAARRSAYIERVMRAVQADLEAQLALGKGAVSEDPLAAVSA